METVSSRESLQALPDWSAVPSDSEADRKLVNERIAYFGAVVGLLSFAFYVFNLVLNLLISSDWLKRLMHPATFMHLGAVCLSAGLWLACRKRRRSAAELNVLDV